MVFGLCPETVGTGGDGLSRGPSKDHGKDRALGKGDPPMEKSGRCHVSPLQRHARDLPATGRFFGQGIDSRPGPGPGGKAHQPTLELGPDPPLPLYQTGRCPPMLLFLWGKVQQGGTGKAFRLLRTLHPARVIALPLRSCRACCPARAHGPSLWVLSQDFPSGSGRLQQRGGGRPRSEEHTSELQSRENLVCRLLLEKKNKETSIGNYR